MPSTPDTPISEEQRAAVIQQLMEAPQFIYHGKCLDITVDNFRVTDALVVGEDAILKIVVEQLLSKWGVERSKLHSGTVRFIIADFTQSTDHERTLESV